MKKELYRNKKIYWGIGALVLIAFVITGLCLLSGEKEGLGIAITEEIYRSYDHYGFDYDKEESEVYVMLQALLPMAHFKLALETDNHRIYTTTYDEDIEAIATKLKTSKVIREVAYSESRDSDGVEYLSYWVDYIDTNGDRINVSYFDNGMAMKTIAYINEDKAVTVNNNLTRDVYYMKLTKDNPIFLTETWQSLVGKEFTNYDDWAGSGFYFQQVGNEAYCTLMIYGSGVRVADYYTSPVTMSEEGSLAIYLPKSLSTGYLIETSPGEAKMMPVSISYENDQVILGERIFTYDAEAHNYEYINVLE